MAAVAGLSEGAIIGIAVAGSTALLLVLVSSGLRIQRKRDQKKQERLLHIEAQPLEIKELASFLRSERPRDDYIPNSLNVVPSLPMDHRARSIYVNTIVSTDILDHEPPLARANTKRLSPTRALSRLSTGIRDSWPLANSAQMPNALHSLARLQSQSQSTITINQVAPPGYLITCDPKYPNRTYSRSSKTKVSKDVVRHHRPLQPTNKPSSQLTTILRSTSDRLRPSQSRRASLSRTLTSFNRSGPPPTERPPTPKRTVRTKESHEALIDNCSTVSIESSMFGEQILRTPSPEKKIARKAGKVYYNQDVPPPSPARTDESLCGLDYTDQAIIMYLSSPNKQYIGEHRKSRPGVSPVRMSPVESKDYPTMLRKGNRASVQALGHATRNSLISEVNDPFYSTNPSFSEGTAIKVDEPRPLFIRKSAASISDQWLPLKDISGNSQTPVKRDHVSVISTAQDNPFQWSPQEAIRSTARSIQPGKKSHKRSKTVRMSILPAAPSSVSMVPEESEVSETETLPFRFHVPSPGVRIVEPSKSPSPSPGRSLLQRRQQRRPPSNAAFDPHIHIPPKIPMGRTITSPFGAIQIYSPTMPSPTRLSLAQPSPSRVSHMRLSPYLISDFDSGTKTEDISIHNPKLSPSTTHSRRECSIVPVTSPTTLLDEMIGFPRPPTTFPSHQPKRSINFAPATFSVLPTTRPISVQTPAQIRTSFPQSIKSPALSPNSEILKALENHRIPQPVLTLPFIPGHLTGPRGLPPKYSSTGESTIISKPPSPPSSRSQTQKAPRTDSLHQSICMLRRMNSDVSEYESPTSTYSRTERSPSISPQSTNFRKRTSRRESGSMYYHNITNSINHRRSANYSNSKKHRISKHFSTPEHRISKIITSRQLAFERETATREISSDTETEHIVDATPLDPSIIASSSPVTEHEDSRSSVELRFSSLSTAENFEYSLPDLAAVGVVEREEIVELESPVRLQDWSDNIPKNSHPIRFSKLEHPGAWNNIVLTPKGDESKENTAPHYSVVRNYIRSSRDGETMSSSVFSNGHRRNGRNSDARMYDSQVHGDPSASNDRKIQSRLSAAGARESVHHNAIGAERTQKRKENSIMHLTTDKASSKNLWKKPRTIWSNLNGSTRDSLYDSDGFLRSSPTRMSGCS